MGTYRQKAAARLCLALAVGSVAAGVVLLRPAPADAGGTAKRQFFFGPVYIADGQTVEFGTVLFLVRPS